MKKIILVLLCLTLSLFLTACEDKKDSQENNDQTINENIEQNGVNDEQEEIKEEQQIPLQDQNSVQEQPTPQIKPQIDNTPTKEPEKTPSTPTKEPEKTPSTPNKEPEQPAKVCTPKKFNHKYTYVYQTEEICKKEGNLRFLELSDTVLPNIFVYSCDKIVDECGDTYYGVKFNEYDHNTNQVVDVYY